MMATRALALLLVAIALVAGGYLWGASATQNTYEVALAKQRDKAQAEYRAEVQRGQAAATHYINEHLDREKRYADIENRNRQLARTVGLIAPRPAVDTPGTAGGAGAGAVGCSDPAAAGALVVAVPAAPPGAAEQAGSLGAEYELSGRAVWLWNSALAGRDVPAGTCGLAAATGGTDAAACAQGTGLGLEDAWDNHFANARACAADRARHQALIDFIKGRPQ